MMGYLYLLQATVWKASRRDEGNKMIVEDDDESITECYYCGAKVGKHHKTTCEVVVDTTQKNKTKRYNLWRDIDSPEQCDCEMDEHKDGIYISATDYDTLIEENEELKRQLCNTNGLKLLIQSELAPELFKVDNDILGQDTYMIRTIINDIKFRAEQAEQAVRTVIFELNRNENMTAYQALDFVSFLRREWLSTIAVAVMLRQK